MEAKSPRPAVSPGRCREGAKEILYVNVSFLLYFVHFYQKNG